MPVSYTHLDVYKRQGSNTVIGSGSVVTKDIPSGVVAVGNPCKVLRTVTEEDMDE